MDYFLFNFIQNRHNCLVIVSRLKGSPDDHGDIRRVLSLLSCCAVGRPPGILPNVTRREAMERRIVVSAELLLAPGALLRPGRTLAATT